MAGHFVLAKVKFRRLRHTILENSFLLHKILKLLRSSWVFDKSLKFVIEKLEKKAPHKEHLISVLAFIDDVNPKSGESTGKSVFQMESLTKAEA